MAITYPLTTLADGQIISKTFIDALVDNENHLMLRPAASAAVAGTGQTATTTTYVQATSPSITVTPKISGRMLLLGTFGFTHSLANGQIGIRYDYNGVKTPGVGYVLSGAAGAATSVTLVAVISVTANVAYTIRMEFSNLSAGTVTFTASNVSHMLGLEF